ncbi:MAG TPA: hypothetical protein VL727_17320 [Puia sp.]|jgi:hypothetical protein|nr:hypothetical protein [Puia sp.]
MRSIHISLISLILLAACGQPNASGKSPQKQDSTPISDSLTSKAPEDTSHYTFAHADDYEDRMPINLPPSLANLVPKGYSVLDTASGDLNLDSLPDMILILHRTDEAASNSDLTTSQRPLLILTGQPDHSLKLATQNNNAVLCRQCGGQMGDPYQRTVIKKGYFSLEFYGGAAERWEEIITFKYAPTDSTWYLHKFSKTTFDAADEKARHNTDIISEKDFGKISFNEFNASESLHND